MQQTQYHLDLTKKSLEGAEYAVVMGDPERVPVVAAAFDKDAKCLSTHRGYVTYLARFQGQAVVISTTGIGGPSTSIVIEELANLGIRYFLRVGTTGAIQPQIRLGDFIITEAAVRLDGASTHYAPIEFPAVASFEFTASVVEAAKHLALPYHAGITVSSDTFFPGQERYESFGKYVIQRFQGTMHEWQQLKALNYEMESATLLTLCRVFGLEAACFCGVVGLRTASELPARDIITSTREASAALAVKAIALQMAKR